MKLSSEEKEARKLARQEARKAAKRQEQIEAQKNQKPVKSITISVEWKKSRVWRANPHATAAVEFHDGTFLRQDGFTASGCGYDKLSTVVGQVFNEFLRYKLWAIPYSRFVESQDQRYDEALPYGMHAYSEGSRSYGEGIGTNCFIRISEAIGGRFETIAEGKSFDVFKYMDNQ